MKESDYKIAIGLPLVFVVLSATTAFVATACGSFHDDAIYVSTAKSLAEGTGYNLINLPGSPPQTKYPILYPLLLALIWKVFPSFPQNLWVMQGLTLLSAAASLGLTYLYLVRFGYASRALSFAAVALAATTPFVQFVSTRVLSEMPFALLLVLALWRLEHALLGRDDTRTRQFVTGLIIALPFLCRSIGVVLPGVALGLLVIRRRPAAATAAGLLLATGPWIYWSLTALGHWQQDTIVGYYTDYLGSWSILATDPARLLGWNLLFMLIATLATCLIGFTTVAGWVLGWKLGPFLLLGGAATWIALLRFAVTLRLLPLFLAAYGTLVVAWPWPPTRFLVPVLPLVLIYACTMAAGLARLLLPTLHRRLLRPALAVALVTNFLVAGEFGRLLRAGEFPYPMLPERLVAWRSYEDVFAWLRDHSRPDDRIASALDSMVYLYTGRQSFRPFRHLPERLFYFVPGPKSGTADEVFEAMTTNRARFLTLMPIPGFEAELSFSQLVAELRRERPGQVVPVYVGRDPRFVVFELKTPATSK